jgi:inhibitor of cysteine peptidase
MKRKVMVTAVVVTILLVASACSLAPGASTIKEAHIEVHNDEFMDTNYVTREIKVPDGSILTVTLGSNPTTGFVWKETAQIANPTVLEQTGNKSIPPEGEGIIGASGSQEWTFKALQKGTTTVNVEYSRPWKGGEKAEWIFELIVTVK